jgi:hypothetical protein
MLVSSEQGAISPEFQMPGHAWPILGILLGLLLQLCFEGLLGHACVAVDLEKEIESPQRTNRILAFSTSEYALEQQLEDGKRVCGVFPSTDEPVCPLK